MTFPDLSKATAIALDIETKDPGLKDKGSSVYRGGGYICGVSLAAGDWAEYFDLRHPGPKRHPVEEVKKYLKAVLALPCPKVGANIMYDVDWLQSEGYTVNGKLYDVQIAEALINENQRSYTLETLSRKYGLGGKVEGSLEAWAVENKVKEKDIKGNIWQMPYHVVRPYALADADQPLKIIKKQWEILAKDKLLDLFQMETDLLRVLLRMRKNGIRIDQKLLGELIERAEKEIPVQQVAVNKLAGRALNVNSFKQVKEWFESEGLALPTKEDKNAQGQFVEKVSFDAASLEHYDHPIAQSILSLKKVPCIFTTFLTSNIRDLICPDGKLHGNFHPAKSDDNGTVTGRLSSSNPNTQQLPNPEKKDYFSKNIRKLYLPEPGCQWGKIDYSQIEVRILAHYAVGPGSDKMREDFNLNPKMDFHTWTASIIARQSVEEFLQRDDWKYWRKLAKSTSFGVMYGMGIKKTQRTLGVDEERGAQILQDYRAGVPFIMETSKRISGTASSRGTIRTIGGRLRHFDDRRWAYKAMNSLIQGSSADMMKKALVDIDRAGLFDVLEPMITVHDEIDCNVPETKEGREAFAEMKRLMEQAYTLRVPVLAEAEIGPNWAELKEFS